MNETASGFSDRLRTALLPRLGDAVLRFPVSVLCAIVASFFLVLVSEDFRGWDREFAFVLRVTGGLVCGGLWALSAVLFGEARGWSPAWRTIVAIAGAMVLFAVCWFHHELDVVEFALVAALLLLVGLAPYVFQARDNRAFWAFNHDTWIGAAFAALAGFLLAAGVSAILATLEYLFKIDVRDALWAQVWIVALGIVVPIYWLNSIPKRFDLQVAESDQKDAELTTRLITILVKFILVPLLLAYTAILYAYAVKIGIGWELPRGRLGYMVSAFGAVGVVTSLLLFPSREHAGRLAAFFWKHWFWLTLVPLLLLYIGVWRRISEYGLTQERYFLIVVGAWLAIVALLFGLRFLARDLRIIPGSLAVLLGVTALGPWGMEGLPLRTLEAELRGLLAAEGSLDANGVLKARSELPEKRETEVGVRMSSIIHYFRRHDRLDRLRPLFGADADTLIQADGKNRFSSSHKTMTRVMERLVIPLHQARGQNLQHVSFNASSPGQVDVDDAAGLSGPFTVFREEFPEGPARYKEATDFLKATMVDDTLRLMRGDVVLGEYDLRAFVKDVVGPGGKRDDAAQVLEPVAGTGQSRLLVIHFYGRIEGTEELNVTNIGFWVVSPNRL